MSEGYLIPLLTEENHEQVEMLACTIKKIDPLRKVVAVSHKQLNSLKGVDQIKVLDGLCDDATFNYFFSLLHSPFDKTIAFLPDQILTKFNTDVWEGLRGLGSMVMLKNRYSFSGETIPDAAYWKGDIELKSFGIASNINAIYFDKTQDASDILGFAIKLCGHYNHTDALNWAKDKNADGEDIFLPFFPEFLWPEWVMSFVQTVLQDKIVTFDFIHSIDLGKQEMNHWAPIWSREPWSRFLNYWVTDAGELKIENFVQHGLVKYQHAGWITDKVSRTFKGTNG